ncbi:hypothetical protein BC829DRAFT_129344 [Chytridium lagenaria]|nr:hypothetical protein BC829DRAFT_129344 [Chytridium lagenaria]
MYFWPRHQKLCQRTMSLSSVPQEVLTECIAPLVDVADCINLSSVSKRFRLIFFALVFHTIDSRKRSIPETLQFLKTSPNAVHHVQNVIAMEQTYEDVNNLRELFNLVGVNLKRLRLYESHRNPQDYVRSTTGIDQFYVETVQLCPNLGLLNIRPSRLSQTWWNSGGHAVELANAIASLAELRGVAIECNFLDQQPESPFSLLLLKALPPGHLTERLTILVNAMSPISIR